jgi:two-component system cell cycle sensor histidine kinase/response regulator CckA
MIEDSEDDALLLTKELERGGYAPEVKRVETKEEMSDALDKSEWDVIIADYKLPEFSGLGALRVMQEKNIDLPFLIVSGGMEEEIAVEVMKAGAQDFITKGKLMRLSTAIDRELGEVEIRKDRKKVEIALKESEEKYHMFFENAADLIAVVTPEGRFLDLNKKFEEESGYSRDEMKGKNVFTCGIIAKEFVPRLMAAMGKILIGKEPPVIEVEGMTKKGERVPYEVKGIPLRKEGKIIAIQATLRNLTYRKKVETSQRLAQLGEMMADMAHEIKNPLQVISGRAQILLMEESKKEDIREGLETICEQCDRTNDLIQRFLYFSKPSKGDFKEVDINESLDYVLHLIEHPYSLKNIKIRKEYMPLPPMVKIDEKRMHEVFLNLVNNSADAMPAGGTITVRTQKGGENLCIDIQDTGSGIEEENLKRVFDSFFTTKEKGTGLGLPLCYSIVKAHEGDLKFTSEVGKGTIATIHLPISKD